MVLFGSPANGNVLLLFDRLVSTDVPATVVSNVTSPFLLTQNLETVLPPIENENGIAEVADHTLADAPAPALYAKRTEYPFVAELLASAIVRTPPGFPLFSDSHHP